MLDIYLTDTNKSKFANLEAAYLVKYLTLHMVDETCGWKYRYRSSYPLKRYFNFWKCILPQYNILSYIINLKKSYRLLPNHNFNPLKTIKNILKDSQIHGKRQKRKYWDDKISKDAEAKRKLKLNPFQSLSPKLAIDLDLIPFRIKWQ